MTRRPAVVVVGSGAAGLSAAVSAAVSRADVTLLEAAPTLGGTTATSGAGLWIPANPWAAARGVDDSADAAIRYLRRITGVSGKEAFANGYVRESVRVATVIEQHTPLRWQPIEGFPDYLPDLDGAVVSGRSLETDVVQVERAILELIRSDPYSFPPMTINEERARPDDAELERRRHEGIVARGRAVIAGLYATLRDLGGTVLTGVVADELSVEGDAVKGVRAAGTEYRGEVVLCSGGFERNAQLVHAFLPGPMTAPAGPPSNRGDALLMGLMAGAALDNMMDAWFVPAMHIPGETIDGAPFYRVLFTDFAKSGGIVVDQRGKRFMNEAKVYYSLGRSLQHFDAERFTFPRSPSWFVFDSSRMRQGIANLSADAPEPEWLISADTIEALAAAACLPEDQLSETVKQFNTRIAAGQADEFRRGESTWDRFSAGSGGASPLANSDNAGSHESGGVLEAPFYAIEVQPGCSGTKGGLLTDDRGRVLRAKDLNVLPGLYAAGNTAAYPFGLAYPGPGATIGPGMVYGWLAGETAAASA